MDTSYAIEFRCIADHGSFTEAARELHLTQSTLSKHVATLERDLGADLFVRDRSGLRLTAAGEVLYGQAVQLDRLLRRTRRLVQAAAAAGADADADAGVGALEGRAGGDIAEHATQDVLLRGKCRTVARRCGLDRRETGALVLYLEERGLRTIQEELGLTRDEVADVLGGVYRTLGVTGKQEALDFVHSVSE